MTSNTISIGQPVAPTNSTTFFNQYLSNNLYLTGPFSQIQAANGVYLGTYSYYNTMMINNNNVTLNGKLNGNTIQTGTGSLALGSYSVTAIGNATLSGYPQTTTLTGAGTTTVTGTAPNYTVTGAPIQTFTLCCAVTGTGSPGDTMVTSLGSFSSYDLSTALTDETGTGAVVFGTQPTFTNYITTPKIIGGTSTSSGVIYQSTTGVGTSTVAAHTFLGGNNGDTPIFNLTNGGDIVIGTFPPASFNANYRSGKLLTGNATKYSMFLADTVGTDVTLSGGVTIQSTLAAGSHTVTILNDFTAGNCAIGAGATLTSFIGLRVTDLTGGTNNYGVYSLMTSGTSKWFIYGKITLKVII